jgi:hypothetical protein
MTTVSIINGTVNTIGGSKKESTLVGCFFVDVIKRPPRRSVHKGIFIALHVVKKKGGRNFLVRLLDVPL